VLGFCSARLASLSSNFASFSFRLADSRFFLLRLKEFLQLALFQELRLFDLFRLLLHVLEAVALALSLAAITSLNSLSE